MSSAEHSVTSLAQDRGWPAVIGMVLVTVISTVVVVLRLYARGYVIHELGRDDYLITLAQLASWLVVALSIEVVHYGAGQHLAFVMQTPEKLVLLLKWLVAAQLVYMANLFLCRISGLAFYARLNSMPPFVYYLRISFAFVTAVYLAQTLIIALQCIPLATLWNGAPGKCMGSKTVFIATSVLTILCDSLVLLLPLNIVFSIQADLKRRIMLILIMCMGVFAVVTSIIRTVSLLAAIHHPKDATWYYSVVMVWSCTEISTAIIALSLPALKALFVTVRKNRSTTDRSTTVGGDSHSESIGLGSTSRPIFEGPKRYRNIVDVGCERGVSQERLWGVNDGPKEVQIMDTVRVDIDRESNRET